jgi:hypothetical protein
MNPGCKTVIEGNYYQNIIWHGRTPALVIESFNGNSTLYGELIEVNDKGIVFDAERNNPLFNAPKKLYKYKDIVCAINEEGEIIYGEIPKGKNNIFWTMNLEFISVDSLNKNKYKITLYPNRRFSYCMPPGIYSIENITFLVKSESAKYDITSEAKFLPNITMNVKQDYINYIGDIFLNFKENIGDSVIVLPFQSQMKTGKLPMSNFPFSSIPSSPSVEELKDQPIQYHLLQIKMDVDYKPQKKSLPLQFTKLTAINNTNALELIEVGEIQKYKYKME